MKVLMLNGSPHANGNTSCALNEMKKVFEAESIETEVIQVGNETARGCAACFKCKDTGRCVFDDIVNVIADKLQEADGLVIASPVYFAMPNGALISVLQRLFYSTYGMDKRLKVGGVIAIARRAGTSATFDTLNKFLGYSGMAIAGSSYWNLAFGKRPGEVLQDEEGIGVIKNLAHNMIFLMKSIALGNQHYGLPEKERYNMTDFIKK